jgi:hypothetical protein
MAADDDAKAILQKQYDDHMAKMVRHAALTSAGVGGIYGSIAGLLNGAKNPKELLSLALKDAAVSGAVGGGGTYVGAKIFGAPDPDDRAPMSKRVAVGGAATGATAGGALGALAGKGLIKPSEEALMTRYFGRLAANPSAANAAKGALAGVAMGGLLGGYLGNEEGQAMDTINNIAGDHVRKKIRKARERELALKMDDNGGGPQ